MKTLALASLIAAAPLMGALTAQAAETPYLCTGVGEEERAEAVAFPHTLRLVFAQADGHYLSNVSTTVEASDGQSFQVTCDGPWLLMDLPQGSYKVTGLADGKVNETQVKVGGNGTVEHVLTF